MESSASTRSLITPSTWRLQGHVERSGSLAASLAGVLSAADVEGVFAAARADFDLEGAKPGQAFHVAVGLDGQLQTFSYAIDELRTLRVVKQAGRFDSDVLSRSFETRLEAVAGILESSLFDAIERIGERTELALELSDIFGWDVDFNTSIQRGDLFRVLVEKVYLGGRFRRYGRIVAAEFVNADRTIVGVRFEGRGGRAAYYSPSGQPLKRAFLKSPLRYTRVSSSFSTSRYHPLLRFTRAHRGTDLAAPHGTPVRSVGDGMVTTAAFQGGFGNLVVVRHAHGYASYYGHLSRFRVKPGQRLEQGDVVGLVGATGLATGPHLHYGITRSGAWTDPMRVQGPPADPLDPADLEAFRGAAVHLLKRLPPRPVRQPTLRAAQDSVVW